MARIVFRGGMVFDGGLDGPRPADVVVAGDRIAAVAPDVELHDGDRVIDATGCVVMMRPSASG